jgi:hypothetical protein
VNAGNKAVGEYLHNALGQREGRGQSCIFALLVGVTLRNNTKHIAAPVTLAANIGYRPVWPARSTSPALAPRFAP